MSNQKLHADEVDIDMSLVKELLFSQFPEYAHLSVTPIDSAGTDNVIYRLGDRMALRLPRMETAASQIEMEYEWLPRLAAHLPLAIPRPLKKGKSDENYPWSWSIYEWLDGENATIAKVVDLDQAAIMLGHFIASLHKINPSGGPLSKRGLPLISRDESTRRSIELLREDLDASILTAIWKAALAAPAWAGSPVWIHGDLTPCNLLVREGKLCAVIDFGLLGIGDPACDMMVAWTFLTEKTRKIFRETVDVDDATWDRGRGWALTFSTVALPYYKDTNPALAQVARTTLHEVLAEYEAKK